MKKIYFSKILFLLTFWVLAGVFITTYEGAILGFKPPLDGISYRFSINFTWVVFQTLLAGSFIACVEVLFLSKRLRKLSFGGTDTGKMQ